MKSISKFLFIIIFLLLIGLGTISAAESETNSSQTSDIIAQEIITHDVIEDTSVDNDFQTNQCKSIEKDNKIESNDKTVKSSSATITVTSSNYDQFFSKKANVTVSSDLIQSGDIINLKGTFNNVDFAVDKAITLTSLNNNALLYNCSVYIQGSSAAGSTVSNLVITNNKEQTTGIQVKNTTGLTIKDNTVKVNGRNSFAFAADKMTYSTIKSNYFEVLCAEGQSYAHSTFVLGTSDYNTIANNTVHCEANGIYLSWYGNLNANFEGGASNYNNITGNNVTGSDNGWCYTIQVMGSNNIISHNTVSNGFRGISVQDYENNIISYNNVHASTVGIYACEGATVSNNNVHVTGTASGITAGGDGVEIKNNVIQSVDGQGIDISANNIKILNNNITSSNSYGIYSKGQYNYINIENNKINSNGEGILFKKQSSTKKINNVRVSNNNIISQAEYAINFYDAGARDAADVNITVTSSNVLTSMLTQRSRMIQIKQSLLLPVHIVNGLGMME